MSSMRQNRCFVSSWHAPSTCKRNAIRGMGMSSTIHKGWWYSRSYLVFKARLSLPVLLSSPLFAYVFWAVLQVILQIKPQVHHMVLAGHPCRARGVLPLRWECDCTCSSSPTKLGCAHSLAAWLHKRSNKHFSKIKMRTGDCLEVAEWILMLFWEKQRK